MVATSTISSPASILYQARLSSRSNEKKTPVQVTIPLQYKLGVGAVAGAIGATTTFPIDVVKTNLQSQLSSATHVRMGPIQCLRGIVAADGIHGLYRGLPPTVLGGLPEKALKLAVNEQLREKFTDEHGNLPLRGQLTAALGAGLAQAFVTNPTEMVKIRLQTQTALPPHQRESALQIIRGLGPRGLYTSFHVCLMRDLPYSLVFFPSYAFLKSSLANDEGVNSMASILVSGAIAGASASGLCTPMDVIKTRRQVRGAIANQTLLQTAQSVYQTSGLTGFYRGASLRMMVQAPMFGITLTAFELQKKYMESKMHQE